MAIRTITWEEAKLLFVFVVVLGLACIGLIQFLKESKLLKRWKKRVLTVAVILGLLLLNTTLVPAGLGVACTAFCLLVSVVKLGFDAFVEGIPGLIRGKMNALGKTDV